MCVTHIKSPLENARRKVEQIYTGPLDTEVGDAMFECKADVSINTVYDYKFINSGLYSILTACITFTSASLAWQTNFRKSMGFSSIVFDRAKG